jgi:hypothetical protein
VVVVLASGCQRPPQAPAGLDDSARYLLREFYADEATVGAGLSGLLAWYGEEGAELLSTEVNPDNSANFALELLDAADVQDMPSSAGQSIDLALGAVGVGLLGCSWRDTEPFLVRADQDVVFEGEWSHYDRTFDSPRAAYEDAEPGTWPELGGLDPVSEGFPRSETNAGLLLTTNPLGTDEATVRLDYTLRIAMRHGTFPVDGEDRDAGFILTWLPDPSAPAGTTDSSIQQVYSIDVLIDVDEGQALRLVATWNHVENSLLDPQDSSNLMISATVRRIARFAERLSGLCEGTLTIPAE